MTGYFVLTIDKAGIRPLTTAEASCYQAFDPWYMWLAGAGINGNKFHRVIHKL